MHVTIKERPQHSQPITCLKRHTVSKCSLQKSLLDPPAQGMIICVLYKNDQESSRTPIWCQLARDTSLKNDPWIPGSPFDRCMGSVIDHHSTEMNFPPAGFEWGKPIPPKILLQLIQANPGGRAPNSTGEPHPQHSSQNASPSTDLFGSRSDVSSVVRR